MNKPLFNLLFYIRSALVQTVDKSQKMKIRGTNYPLKNEQIVIGILGVAILFAMILIPIPEKFNNSFVIGALMNAIHGPLFACMACFAAWLLGNSTWRSYIFLWIALASLGLITEFAQELSSRNASWGDVLVNLLGTTSGLAIWGLFFDKQLVKSSGFAAALTVVAVVCIFTVFFPPIKTVGIWIERQNSFPVLFNAEFPEALAMTESLLELEDVNISIEEAGLSVRLLTGGPAGLVITDFSQDWRDYHALVIDLVNLGAESLSLEVHVRDAGSSHDYSDRFNAKHVLEAGQRGSFRYSLPEIEAGPESRSIQLNTMSLIAIYRVDGESDHFLLGSIKLE